MAYAPLKVRSQNRRNINVSAMARKGLNLEGLPEMMDLNYAKKIVNYIPYSYGIGTRGGLETQDEIEDITEGMTLCKYFTDGNFILGYGTTIVAWNILTGIFTTIKDDFSASTRWGGGRYGEYFFVTNGVDKPYRIDNALSETIINNAPICDDITFIGPRAVAISSSTDETAVQISEVDDGTNPPFNNWTTTTAATAGAIVRYRNAGKARCCVPIGNIHVVFSDDGYFAFTVDQLDSAGTLKKIENIQDYVTDFGGGRGAISTPKGIFYFNEAGLWQMTQVGQTDVPYSRQQKLTTVLLNDSYFNDASFDNADLIYDEAQKIVLGTYAQGSSVNNKVIGYKISEKIEAIFEIDGWTLNRFTKYDGKIYASSSTDGKIFECFKGHTDDELEISCEYTQELPLKTLWAKHSMREFYAKGFLSIDTVIDVNFDIYDKDGMPVPSKKVSRWTPQRNDNLNDGWGNASWGQSSWGGDFDLSSMVESFDGCRPKIANAQRISVRFTSAVTEPHIINWFSGIVEDKAPIRKRTMQKIT